MITAPTLEERIIKDAKQDREIYNTFVTDGEARNKHLALVKGEHEGAKPLDPQIMRQHGMGNSFNFNTRESEQAAARAMEPFWDLLTSSPSAVNAVVVDPSVNKARYEAIIQEGMKLFFLKNNESWTTFKRNLVKEYTLYGPAFGLWLDNEDPLPENVVGTRVRFAKDTPIDSKKWEIFYIEDSIPITALWKRVKDAKTSDDSGWNIKAVKAALMQAAKSDKQDLTTWTSVQNMLLQGDSYCQSRWGNVQIVTRLSKNMDGKIERSVFTQKELDQDDQLLYEDNDVGDDFGQVLRCITWDVGNNTLHGVRAFGVKNYHISLARNIFAMKFLTGNDIGMGLVLRRSVGATGNMPPMKNWGYLVNELAEGVEVVKDLKVDTTGGINAMAYLDGVGDRNNSQFNERSSQIAKSESATAAGLLGQQQNRADQASASVFLAQVSGFFSEIFRRLRTTKHKDSVAFRKYCTERGCPETLFSGDTEIYILAGASSAQFNSAMMLEGLEKIYAITQQAGKNTDPLLEEMIARNIGSEWVSKVMPQTEMTNISSRRQAEIEDFAMGFGKEMQVDPLQDDHVAHVEDHMITVEQTIQIAFSVMQSKALGQEIAQGNQQRYASSVTYLALAMPHINIHLQHLAKDPLRKVKFQELQHAFQQAQNKVNSLPEFQARGLGTPK